MQEDPAGDGDDEARAPQIKEVVLGFVPVLQDGEHGEPGDYAASGISSTSRSGYHRLNIDPNARFNVFTRVCRSKWAPRFDHCICCCLQKRLLTTWFTVDSTKPVAMASPWR